MSSVFGKSFGVCWYFDGELGIRWDKIRVITYEISLLDQEKTTETWDLVQGDIYEFVYTDF